MRPTKPFNRRVPRLQDEEPSPPVRATKSRYTSAASSAAPATPAVDDEVEVRLDDDVVVLHSGREWSKFDMRAGPQAASSSTVEDGDPVPSRWVDPELEDDAVPNWGAWRSESIRDPGRHYRKESRLPS